MFKLHLIQAEHGDCLLLEAGTNTQPTYILVDGGPRNIFRDHLESRLRRVRGDRLHLVVLSHVDNDHIVGLLDLVAELRAQRAGGESELVTIDNLWINRFDQTVDRSGEIEPRLRSMVTAAATAGHGMSWAGTAVAGIPEGHTLQAQATAHGVPINRGFPDLVQVDTAPNAIPVGPVTFTIVGPTEGNLEELRQDWLDWLDDFEDRTADPAVAANADRSVPNLSSITFVAEAEGRRILMTGDARGDHLEQGLGQAGLLSGDGTVHVDVLKLQHHGSNRNVTKGFFRRITADTYVISANGKHDNPDFSTLKWMVDAAHEQARRINILVTNQTASTREIARQRRPHDFGYRLRTLRRGRHSTVLRLHET